MKRIAIKMIAGLAFTSVFYFGMCYSINRVSISGKRAACWVNPQFQRKGGQEARLMKDWDARENYDVIVIGSSHAYRGYDPREFQASGYNLFAAGTGFQNTLASYVLSKDVFKPKKNSLVIIDLFDQTFVGDGVGCYTRVIQNAGSDRAAWEFVERKPDIRTFNSYWCRMFSKHMPEEIADEDGYLTRGYCPKTDSLETPTPELELNETVKFNTQFAHYLDKLIHKLMNDTARVVLVSHPQPLTVYNDAYHRQFLQFIQPILAKHKLKYLDYNSNHSLHNMHHFADANHLNQSGVSIWNRQLIDTLIQHELLELKLRDKRK
ncbi:MAG: hypothetical protein ACKVOR_01860 [Flavobacteriales bacterium]